VSAAIASFHSGALFTSFARQTDEPENPAGRETLRFRVRRPKRGERDGSWVFFLLHARPGGCHRRPVRVPALAHSRTRAFLSPLLFEHLFSAARATGGTLLLRVRSCACVACGNAADCARKDDIVDAERS